MQVGGNKTQCQECEDGTFEIEGCPHEYVGNGILEAIPYATQAMKGNWPILGGTLQQSYWFLQFVGLLENEQNLIDAERAERQFGKYGR